jgi:3-methyladenine DNA glycosylase/8-oxoguanine DNA glycosylase
VRLNGRDRAARRQTLIQQALSDVAAQNSIGTLCDNFPDCASDSLGYRVVPSARVIFGVLQQAYEQLTFRQAQDSWIVHKRAR